MPPTISAEQAKSLGWGQSNSSNGLPSVISAGDAKSMGWNTAPQTGGDMQQESRGMLLDSIPNARPYDPNAGVLGNATNFGINTLSEPARIADTAGQALGGLYDASINPQEYGAKTALGALGNVAMEVPGVIGRGISGIGNMVLGGVSALGKSVFGKSISPQAEQAGATAAEEIAQGAFQNPLQTAVGFDAMGGKGVSPISEIVRGLKTTLKKTTPLRDVLPMPKIVKPVGITSPENSANIMQRVARTNPTEMAKFEKMAGQRQGEYLVDRGIFGNEEKVMEQLYNRFESSKNTGDEALATLKGTFQHPPVRTALDELVSRESKVSTEGAPSPDNARITELSNKYDRGGLDMSEINEVKRIYERTVKLDYLRSNLPESVARANNIDSAIRSWQVKKASDLGLKNIADIHKETQLAKQLLDSMGKKQAGASANNAISLTDWIMLSGGDSRAIAGYIAKRTFGNKTVQSAFAKAFAPEATIGAPQSVFGARKLPVESLPSEYTDKLPTIEAGTIPKKTSTLPVAEGAPKVYSDSTTSSKPQTQQLPQKVSVQSSPNPTTSAPKVQSLAAEPAQLPTIQMGPKPQAKVPALSPPNDTMEGRINHLISQLKPDEMLVKEKSTGRLGAIPKTEFDRKLHLAI